MNAPADVVAALQIIERIESRTVAATPIDNAADWSRCFRSFVAGGWRIVVFDDAGGFDYIERMVTPDGGVVEPYAEDACSCDGIGSCDICRLRNYRGGVDVEEVWSWR